MSFEEDLKAAQAAPRRHEDLTVKLNGKPLKLRFRRMAGIDWAVATGKFPMRPDVAMDRAYGYNLHGLISAEIADMAFRIEGKEEIAMPADKWKALLAALDGGAVQDIVNTVFALNEYADAAAVRAAKKALDESVATLALLSSSASHRSV